MKSACLNIRNMPQYAAICRQEASDDLKGEATPAIASTISSAKVRQARVLCGPSGRSVSGGADSCSGASASPLAS